MTNCKIKGDCRTAFRACMKQINKHRSPSKVGVAFRHVDMIAVITFMANQVRFYGYVNPWYRL